MIRRLKPHLILAGILVVTLVVSQLWPVTG